MKHLNLSIDEYINYLQENPIEIDLFLDKFTINYTYFFRNLTIFENFEKYIKVYVRYHQKDMLKIWSAPCATGDEPYTIAMILDNLKRLDKNFPDFRIFASDIDTNALKIAREGIYGEYAVHEMPKHYLSTYFSKKVSELGPKYTLCKEIKDKVEFIQEDIIRGHKKNNIYDVIFCRNFFIYINFSARESLLRNLERKIHEGGLLILGGSENITKENTTFNSISIRDHFYIKNLFNNPESYKNALLSLFPKQRMIRPAKKEKSKVVISKTDELKKRFKKVKAAITPINNISIKKKIKEENIKTEIEENPLIEPAEVRITEIVVNNDLSENLSTTYVDHRSDNKEDLGKRQERELIDREILLKQKETDIERKLKDIEEQYKLLDYERKEVKKGLNKIEEKERDITNRMLVLERVTRQIEQRERAVNLREEQLEKRLVKIEQYSKKMIQQELHINKKAKKIDKVIETEDEFALYEEKRMDQVKNPNNKKEIAIKMGYYALINSFDKSMSATKFKIEGLGSGIGLILKDGKNNVFGMSHISLPDSSASKQGYHLLFPHTFADTSVKDLLNNLLYNGADRENLKALIVGGAKLFLDYDMTYQDNIDTVKRELGSLEIGIEAEDIGGLSERSVIYDTINDSLFVKKSWEFQYRKII